MLKLLSELTLYLLVAVTPFLFSRGAQHLPAKRAVDLPREMLSQIFSEELRLAPLSTREEEFFANFPGQLWRFNGPSYQILLRGTSQVTRLLHPSSDCYRGLGFETENFSERRDKGSRLWSCFEATRGDDRLTACSLMICAEGEHWTDISQWYWDATLGSSRGPWWALTVAWAEGAQAPDLFADLGNQRSL
jgi:hypothetical protein